MSFAISVLFGSCMRIAHDASARPPSYPPPSRGGGSRTTASSGVFCSSSSLANRCYPVRCGSDPNRAINSHSAYTPAPLQMFQFVFLHKLLLHLLLEFFLLQFWLFFGCCCYYCCRCTWKLPPSLPLLRLFVLAAFNLIWPSQLGWTAIRDKCFRLHSSGYLAPMFVAISLSLRPGPSRTTWACFWGVGGGGGGSESARRTGESYLVGRTTRPFPTRLFA